MHPRDHGVYMTMLSLGEAAKLTDLGKTTPAGSTKAERLSAIRRDDASDEVESAELHRAYPFPAPQEAADATVAAMPHPRTVSDSAAVLEAQINGLRELGALLRRQLDDVKDDRDRWRAQAERLALLGSEKRSRWAWMRLTE